MRFISGHHNELGKGGDGRNQCILLRINVTIRASLALDQQPPKQHVLGHWMDPIIKKRPHYLIEPCLHVRASCRVLESLDTDPDFGHRDFGCVQIFGRLDADEIND